MGSAIDAEVGVEPRRATPSDIADTDLDPDLGDPRRDESAADEGPPALEQGSRIGRYSILTRLGAGGMGIVYKAWDPQLDRPIALKVLLQDWTPSGSGPSRREVLLNEAKTLAKLSHPNIVTVYDAGLTPDGMFLAMELSEGKNLHEWLEQESPTIREVLRVFIAAGRGLAAVHAAGIVHRDFKPANVLISDDGGVRVADFGLANLMGPRIPASDPSETRQLGQADQTATSIVGTPLFMSPEQLLGRVGDHRQDQFSFCLSLYSALLGAPAFSGRTFLELRILVPAGLGEPARERLRRARQVPARVRRAVLRGLLPEPEQRFESMDALLAQLEERRLWPWTMAAATLVLGLGVGTAVGIGASHDDACGSPRDALEGVWSDADREDVRRTFLALEHPDAGDMLERTTGRLDAYAQSWTDTYASLCRDTFVTRQQSELLFDARMRCLGGRRTRLRAAIDTLLDVEDFERLQARMVAAFRLPAVSGCAQLQLPASGSSLPADPALRAAVEEQQQQLEVAATLRDASDYPRGMALAADVVEQARALGHPPLLARALETLGHLQTDGASAKAAETTLREAVTTASAAGEVDAETRAWASLLFIMVTRRKLEEGLHLSFAAEAAMQRATDPKTRAWLLNSLGVLHAEREDFDVALDYLRSSLELKQRLLGRDHVDVGIAWFNLGNLLLGHERPAPAREALERALGVFARTVGAEHGFHQLALGGMCWLELEQEHHHEAYVLCDRVLRHFERSPASPHSMGMVHYRTARALVGLGRLDEARAMATRARDLLQEDDPGRARSVEKWMDEKLGAPPPPNDVAP